MFPSMSSSPPTLSFFKKSPKFLFSEATLTTVLGYRPLLLGISTLLALNCFKRAYCRKARFIMELIWILLGFGGLIAVLCSVLWVLEGRRLR